MQLSLFDVLDEPAQPPAKPRKPATLFPLPPKQEAQTPAPEPNPEPYAPSKTTRILDNLAAIKTLYRLEKSGQRARAGDKALLAKYTSFGAVSQVFDESHKDYALVKGLLQPKDYAAARTATVNSFYTQLPIVGWMWEKLQEAGFDGGQILDPAMATGNFFAGMPNRLRRNSTLVGVDMDRLAAWIGGMIHDDAQVHIRPYQESRLPDNGFDVTITNVPFGDIAIFDKALGKHSIHNFYLMKMATQTRPGGFMAAITSRHTLDSKSNAHREWLAQHLDLIAALRLPSNTFAKYAGTNVVTDILLFHKPADGQVKELYPNWLHAQSVTLVGPRGDEEFTIYQHFLEQPDFVLGDFNVTSGPYGAQLKVDAGEKSALQRLQETDLDIAPLFVPSQTPAITIEVEDGSQRRPGEFFLQDGKLRQKTAVGSEAVKASGKKAERILGQLRITAIARQVLTLNTAGSDAELAASQQLLRQEYDRFVAKLGYLNSQANRSVFRHDPNSPFLWALESKCGDDQYEPTEIFYKRTIQQPTRPDFVEDAVDALSISISDTGGVDWPLIAKLTQKEIGELQQELAHIAFLNPRTEQWEPAHVYLSGNVRQKLKDAIASGSSRGCVEDADSDSSSDQPDSQRLQTERKLNANVKALESVQPEWLTHDKIHAALGASWIEPKYVEQFHYELLDPESPINDPQANQGYVYQHQLRWGSSSVSRITVRHSPQLNKWIVATQRMHTALSTQKWGTPTKNAYELIVAILNKSDIKVWEEDSEGNRYVNKEATIAAQQKAHEIKQAFQQWIWTDEERRTHLENIYNHLFNATVPTQFDGSWLNFPGMSEQFTLRPHQANGVARILSGRHTLLWHIVGAGKSATMIASAMKAKQLGLRNKPLHVVPNHLLHQYAAEFYRFYPGANLLVIDPKAMAPSEKARAMAQIATGDWDSVIITHSSFNRIPLSPQTHEQFHQRRMEAINAIIEELKQSYEEADKRTVKQLEKKRLRLQEKVQRTVTKIHHEQSGLYWESLGIEIVFTQMTKARDLTLRASRNDVANLNMFIINNNAVDEQLNELATLVKGKRIQSGLNPLTKFLNTDRKRSDIKLFLNLSIQLAELVFQTILGLSKLRAFALKLVLGNDFSQINLEQTSLLSLKLGNGVLNGLTTRLKSLRQPLTGMGPLKLMGNTGCVS